ncbi:MAG: hypothetical protein ACYDCX_09170 [Acidithiobacillus sp.]
MPSHPDAPSPHPAAREGGSALVMVIFIIVVLALLLAALAYINAQSNQNTAYQIASTRAYWAAQSGAEWGVWQVTANNGSCASQTNLSLSYANTSNAGLAGCTATVACSSAPTASVTSYRVSSQGTCPAGNLGIANGALSANRSIIVGITETSGSNNICVNCINNCLGNYCILLINTYYCFPGLNGCLNRCGVKLDRCTSVECLYNQCGGTSNIQAATLSYWLESP